MNMPVWVRLNNRGPYHGNRRLLKHRARNCECEVCYREIYKLSPATTQSEYVNAVKQKIKEKEIKTAKRLIKRDIRKGKQQTIDRFF